MTVQTAPHDMIASAPVARRDRHLAALLPAIVVAALAVLPIAIVIGIALTGSGEDWPHLVNNVLPGAAATTLALLAMVAVGTASIGVTCAWLVVAYDFPMRRILAWALVLPLAVPPYLAAYAFGEFFLFTGPVQTALRALLGFQSARDYWFPDIRSTIGTAIVLSSVLFPYVYLTVRVVFLMQGRNIADVARTLGAAPVRVFFRILLPVARPAIIAGCALVLMETLNDIGAAEYLGVNTLTIAVFTTWLNRGSLEGAAQLSTVMLLLVLALLYAERMARRNQRFHGARATHMKARPPRVRIEGTQKWFATLAVLFPVLSGFGIPAYVFCGYAIRRLEQLADPALQQAFVTTVFTAGCTALVTVAIALVLVNATRLSRTAAVGAVARLSASGYALPGTVLGLGLLFALTRLDNSVDAFARAHLGFSTGLLLSGTAAAVVIACTVRFLALAEGAIRAGLEKLPPHLDEAARSLGQTPTASARRVLFPLLKPALLTAAVLVFVDTMKELSATILLRPFGFSTLATHVYESASRGVVEDGAMAAILIILTALLPVVLLSRALMRDADATM